MSLLKWGGAIAIAWVLPWPATAAEPQTCDGPYYVYTPCEINATVPAGGSTTALLSLTFVNPANFTYSWIIVASSESSCQTGSPWAVVLPPNSGDVPPRTVNWGKTVTVSMSAAALARGVHTAYACIWVDYPGAAIVAVPINLAVDDVIFVDGFEA